MRLETLREYLIDQGVELNVYVHRMSPIQPQGVLIRSALTGMKIDHELPGYFRNDVQVIVRHAQQAEGDRIAANISKMLTLVRKTLSPTLHIVRMLPESLPVVYPRSEGGEIEWSIIFHAAYRMLEE